jgi:hypothetical protein
MLENDDMAGCETWHRILNAIERLQAPAPAEGEHLVNARVRRKEPFERGVNEEI